MKLLQTIEEAFIGFLIMGVTGLLFVNVILRYVFSANLSWAEELIRFGIIWVTFIGSSICFQKGIHVGIDVLIDALPGIKKTILQLIINILSLLLMVFLVKYGFDLVIFSAERGQIAPALKIKIYWVYLAIPVGAVLSILYILIDTYSLLWSKEPTLKK